MHDAERAQRRFTVEAQGAPYRRPHWPRPAAWLCDDRRWAFRDLYVVVRGPIPQAVQGLIAGQVWVQHAFVVLQPLQQHRDTGA